MPCFYPITAYKCEDGGIVFEERKGAVIYQLQLPCGKCDGCRLERARQWAVRCMHEASLYEQNTFITLTYNDDHLPDCADLVYDDFQKFMKRLRKKFKKPVRFFMCGEYGENNERPHFHACLFGIDFDDKVYYKSSSSGSKLYTSEILNSLWQDRSSCSMGFASVGSFTFDTAGYVARYTLKKRCGDAYNNRYEYTDIETGEVIIRNREFIHMSLKPGIGAGFYKKWKADIFPQDYCIVNGKMTKPPQYYYDLLEKEDKDMYNEVACERAFKALDKVSDNTPDRLEVKEKVLKASMNFLKRNLK